MQTDSNPRYSTPFAEAVERGYVLNLFEGKSEDKIYETDLWCTLYCMLDDDRPERALNAFDMNGLSGVSEEELHKENKGRILQATAHESPGSFVNYFEPFRDNSVVRDLILECYPELK